MKRELKKIKKEKKKRKKNAHSQRNRKLLRAGGVHRKPGTRKWKLKGILYVNSVPCSAPGQGHYKGSVILSLNSALCSAVYQ